ncbi:MAG: YchJ family protein [Gammaproteobacteria bacterium]
MRGQTPCPCGSDLTLAECCEPLIDGAAQAPTPEALMRSRYTAYVLQAIPYIAGTLHPDQRSDYDEAGAIRWAREADWQSLEIIASSPVSAGSESATVEFKASYRRNGTRFVHHEISEFRKAGGTWYFYDGRMISPAPLRHDNPRPGRNDPCPCGSGKKFKKCCGA